MHWKFWRPPQTETPEELVTREWKFQGRSLELAGPLRDAQIEVGGDEIVVEVSGTPSRLEHIKPSQVTGGGRIVYPLSKRSQRVWLLLEVWPQSKWLAWLSKLPGMEVLTPHHLPTVKATVPEGTRIVTRGLFGRTQIGDTHGDIEISTAFKGTTNVGAVRHATIRAKSSSNVTVKSVVGRTIIDADFYSKVHVLQGTALELRIDADSNAEVEFLGEAGLVNIDADFYSHVHVAYVTRNVRAELDSNAKVNIGGGSIGSLVVKADFYSRFSFAGSTQALNTTQDSNASVRVERVEDRLDANLDFYAKLYVGSGGDEVRAAITADSGAQAECNVFVESGRLSADFGSHIAVRGIGRYVDIDSDGGRVRTLGR